MNEMPFKAIKIGDLVTRMLAGSVPMQLRVTEIDEDFIYCGPPDVGWKFSRRNGAEIDEEIGWDEQHTGSVLLSNEGAN